MKTTPFLLLFSLLWISSTIAQKHHGSLVVNVGAGHAYYIHNSVTSELKRKWGLAWEGGAKYTYSTKKVDWNLSVLFSNLRSQDKEVGVFYDFWNDKSIGGHRDLFIKGRRDIKINEFFFSIPFYPTFRIAAWKVGVGPQVIVSTDGFYSSEWTGVEQNSTTTPAPTLSGGVRGQGDFTTKLGGIFVIERQLSELICLHLQYSQSLTNTYNWEFIERPNFQRLQVGIAINWRTLFKKKSR